MNRRMIYLPLVIVVLIVGSLAWNLTARAAYETAEYRVVESDGAIEIREYPDLILASTPMREGSQGNDGSFMRLFRYISGANEAEQKVAMTTPVFMEGAGTEAEGQMGFVLPKEVANRGAPQPLGTEVRLRRREGGRFAVIRFSGRADKKTLGQAERRLRDWIEAKGLATTGSTESAGYDPPWTPGLLRRNELLIRIQAAERSAEPPAAESPVAESPAADG